MIRPASDGLEDQREDGRCSELEQGGRVGPAALDDGTDADHDRDVQQRHKDGQDPEHHGLLDHDVEVVQPVPEDRHGRGHGDSDEQGKEKQEQRDHRQGLGCAGGTEHKARDHQHAGRLRDVGQPSQLLAFFSVRTFEPPDQGQDGRKGRGDPGERDEDEDQPRTRPHTVNAEGVPYADSVLIEDQSGVEGRPDQVVHGQRDQDPGHGPPAT